LRTLFILIFCTSCAGPYTPFGSQFSPSALVSKALSTKEKSSLITIKNSAINANINFFPKYQTLHKSKDIKIIIDDKEKVSKHSKVNFIYNGKDITGDIERIASISKSKDSIRYSIKSLTLPPSEDHYFLVLYKRSSKSEVIVKHYPFPKCDLNEDVKLAVEEMKTKDKIKKDIKDIAKDYSINKALIAGLIAQESSFNPKAVSWAKAVGLTQVTPIAEKQILTESSKWKTYPNWNRLPASILKTYINSGKINKSNDWKLNPRTSIEGGAKYLKYLKYFWSRPQNREAIPLSHRDGELYTSILLASYNSGPSRVKRRLLSHGREWLTSKDLKEAKKYISKVKSYCNNFTIE
jgi:hypothetical protein